MRLYRRKQLIWIATDGDKFRKAVKLLIAGFAVAFDSPLVKVRDTFKKSNGTRLIGLVWLYVAHHSTSYLIRYIRTGGSYLILNANHVLKDCIIAQIKVHTDTSYSRP